MAGGQVAGAGARWDAWPLFERFTQEARLVVVEAQAEARDLGHPYIGTEHLLLALARAPEGDAGQALQEAGVTVEAGRRALQELAPPGDWDGRGQIPFTPRAKQTLELALRESLALGSQFVAPEHLLLGLIRTEDGVGARILGVLGVDLAALRGRLLESLPPSDPARAEGRRRLAQVRRAARPEVVMPEGGWAAEPSPEVRRLLMSAAARALDDGRTVITLADLREAIGQWPTSEEPPQATAG